MKKMSTYLLVMFMVMFWAFRIIVAFCYNLGIEFFTKPYDLSFEIVLLFLTLISIILVIKRKTLGASFYIIGYWLYFGTTIINLISKMNGELALNNYVELIIAAIGIILPVLVLIDLLMDKNRKNDPTDKKTDWFFKNKEYDRQFDERADRNEYRL